ALETALGGGYGLLTKQVSQGCGEAGEANRVAVIQSTDSKILRQCCFTDTSLTTEQDVLATGDKDERLVERLVEVAFNASRMVPIELLEGLERTECGSARTTLEVSRVTLARFDSNELLDELRVSQLLLRCML